jgi:chromosome partitioning protein
MIMTTTAQKGGVGKTSVTVHLAGVAAEAGYKTLVCDLDPQSSLSGTLMRKDGSQGKTLRDLLLNPDINISEAVQKTGFDNIDILPCDLSLGSVEAEFILDPDSQYILQNKLEEAKGRYDLIILDTPPNLGVFTRMALVASDHAIIPIECSSYGIRSTLFLLRLISKIKNRANPDITILGFIINKLDARRTIEQTYLQNLRTKYGTKVFRTEIRNSAKYLEAVTQGKPISYYQPKSEQAEAYRSLFKEIQQQLQPPSNNHHEEGQR